jgi:exonuclease III
MNLVSNLSLLFWNVRGISDVHKCDLVKDIIRNSNAELICLQETKWDNCDIFRIRKIATNRYQDYAVLDSIETRGGILILWSANFRKTSQLRTQHTLSVVLTAQSGFTFLLTNVYGPTNPSLKLSFMNELRHIRDRFQMP